MSRSTLKKITKVNSCWKCPDKCAKQLGKRVDNSDTPVRGVSSYVTPVTSPSKVSLKDGIDSDLGASASDTQPQVESEIATGRGHCSVTDNTSADTELKDLMVVITRLTNELTSLKGKLEEVVDSLCHCHEKMDELQSRVSINDGRIKELEKRDQEVLNLKVQVSLLQRELNAQAQQNLLNEIEIVGIPETTNENLEHIVKVAAVKLGVQLDDGEIDWVTRVGARRSLATAGTVLPDRMPRPVVVRLLRRSKRNQLIRASKSRKSSTTADLNIPGASTKVFFNERLTKENRVLFRETRARAKMSGYAFCWCNQGSIYIRQREGKAAHIIRSLHDLDRILPSAPTENTS